MPAVSNCPKCDAQVSIPLGAPGETEVRCPLCSEEYLLQEALDKAPPELILVNPPEVGEVPAFAASGGGADEGGSESGSFDFFGDAGELKLEDETSSFSFGDDKDSSATSGEGGTATATRPLARKKRKGPGPMFQIVGIVGGGVIGLSAGYFILLWVFHVDIGKEVSRSVAAHKILPAAMIPEDLRVEKEGTVESPNNGDNGGGDNNNDIGSNGNSVVDGQGLPDEVGTGGDEVGTGGDKPGADPPKPLDTGEVDDPFALPKLPDNDPDDDPFSVTPPLKVKPLPDDLPDLPDSPAAEPKTGLKSPPSFDSKQLGTALAAVDKSIKALEESENAGALFELKRRLFQDLCTLGECYTFADDDVKNGIFQDRLLAAPMLANKTVTGKLTVSNIGRFAESWIPLKTRGQQGVLLAGAVDEISNVGGVFKGTLRFSGSKTQARVIVIFAEKPTFSDGGEVLILGHIVEAPKDNLHNYDGDESIVVWARAKGIVEVGSSGS
ncbi:MAG: hypothetical protein IID44_03155 [Planctomycetes bacterium]|nr:hypothetical protein [Planctomycetota bacterium]